MRLKIDQWEVCRAVELYFKEEYGVDYDLVEGLEDWPVIGYRDKVQVFKTHKNGKQVKDEDGRPVVDHTKTTYKKNSVEWKEFDSMTFFLPSKR